MVATQSPIVPCLCDAGVLLDTQEHYILCKQGEDHQVYIPAEKQKKKTQSSNLGTQKYTLRSMLRIIFTVSLWFWGQEVLDAISK